jgi:hypothetical protein
MTKTDLSSQLKSYCNNFLKIKITLIEMIENLLNEEGKCKQLTVNK